MRRFLKVYIATCLAMALGLTGYLAWSLIPVLFPGGGGPVVLVPRAIAVNPAGPGSGSAAPATAVDFGPPARVGYGLDPGGVGAVFITGPLTPATVNEVERLLTTHPGRISAIQVTSQAGTVPAAQRLAAVARRLGARAIIAPGAICGPACVVFLAEVEPRSRVVDRSSWLVVQGDSRKADTDDDPPNRTIARWVGMVSPEWLAFLETCPSKPLSRTAGLAMAWGEIQDLSRPQGAGDCANLAHRTTEWLAAKR